MFQKYGKGLIWGMILFLGTCGIASADEYHYSNLLIGDRASGMGGAYTAISDDPTGLYYNPAGIVYSTGRNLSASVNAFYNQDKKYSNVIGGNGWKRSSSSLLPNYFGVTQPLGRFQFGFSYAVPDSISESQDQAFYGSIPTSLGSPASQYVINFNNEDNTYLVGPSLATEINSNLSVGMTLYLHNRQNRTVLNQLVTLENGKSEWTNQYMTLVERGLKPILGVMWTPMEKVTVGISAAKTYLYGNSKTNLVSEKLSTGSDVTWSESGSSAKRKFPYELRAGVAYFATNSLLVSMDGTYYTKVTDAEYGDRVDVFNAAIGTEYYLNRNWALRGGLFTNMANTPKLDSTRTDQLEKVDLYGGTLSISNFTRNTSVTFGGSLSKGAGNAQLIGSSTNIQHVETNGWMIFLSSSYSY